MTLYLRHVYGSNRGKVGSFVQSRVRIGRCSDNEVRMDAEREEEVSGHHAVIFRDGEEFLVEDLDSTNGTFINGRRISEPTPVQEGDEIEFAPGGPRVIFSTELTEKLNKTNVVGRPNKAANGTRITPTAAVSVSELSRNGENHRIGARTAMFMRNIYDASAHTIKRLRFAMFCTALIFGFIAAGLVLSNRNQRNEIVNLAQRADEIKAANEALQGERVALRQEGEEMQQKLSAQAAELKRLEGLIKKLADGGLQPRLNEQGQVAVNLPNVLFDFDEAALTADGLQKVQFMASALGPADADKLLVIEGHASRESGGNEERNIELSRERSQSVAAALNGAGIDPKRIVTRGFGSAKPIAPNETEDGRRQNRRVEVIIAAAGAVGPEPASVTAPIAKNSVISPPRPVRKAPPVQAAPVKSANDGLVPQKSEESEATDQVEQIKMPMKVDAILDSVFDK